MIDPLPALREAAGRMLAHNWVEGRSARGVDYGYTRPDPVKFPDQFLWDSCLIAVAWARIDPARARRELRTLLAARRPDGLIGHTIFWRRPVRLSRAYTYNLLHRHGAATATIQPPLLAWAWAEVADLSPDEPGFRAEGLEGLRAHHRWLERERADADGLLRILQPDESGLDATPAYDAPLGRRTHPNPGFLLLLRFNRARRFDLRRVVRDGGFHAVDPLVNAAWALAWEGMARLGEPGARERARAIARALVDRLHDRRAGILYPEGPDGTPLRVSTWAGLAPLICASLDPVVARRLIDEHVLNRHRYWLRYPVPSVSAEEPSFRPGRVGFPIERYWRGPTWLFSTRFILDGLLRHGYGAQAEELAVRTARLVLREGFREYYNPLTGRGHGGRAFSVSGL